MHKGSAVLAMCTLLVLSAAPAPAATVRLAAYTFEPAQGEPVLPAGLRASEDAQVFLVQTDGPITPAWTRALESEGAVVYGYIPDHAYLVGMAPAAQARVRLLAGTAWMGPFHPAYKISPDLGTQVLVAPERLRDPNLTLLVRVFRNPEEVASRIEALGARVLERTDDGFSRRLVVSAPRARLEDLARISDVWWIEEKPEFRTLNNTTKWVIQSNAGGYTPIWDHGIYGTGQIATIMDTGVDYNSCWFRENGNAPPGPGHRKIIDYSLYGGSAYDGCDTGHGSHVAGTVLGDQSYINPGNIGYNGMAYKAKLTVQDVGADDWTSCNLGTLNVPSSLSAAFAASYGLGARVHTNSWGSTSNAYDGYSVDVDNAMWQRKDALICFANGNSGPGGSTVGSPATAKNCVSVGATQQAPNHENMASYSSRGPAADGRTKPTLAAPGGEDPIFITSVDNNSGNPPSPTCVTASSPFQGTSMATPAVTGSALDLRQYFVDGFYPAGEAGGASLAPSAALLKAMLIGSTKDMGTGDIPNNNEGWGRILLDNAMYFAGDTRELIVHDISPGLTTGEDWSTDFTVNDVGEPLQITLVWTDYPGTQGAGVELVNDLDLMLIGPGELYFGNNFSGGQSQTGGVRDRRNVEECFRRNTPAPGAYTLHVTGYNVPYGPQPFAVVITGGFANWPPGDPSGVADAAPAAEPFVRAWPNPFGDRTSLHYALPAGWSGPVELRIYDVQGRFVRTLVRKGQTAGDYHVTWEGLDQNGSRVADGIYFARLSAGPYAAQRKIALRR